MPLPTRADRTLTAFEQPATHTLRGTTWMIRKFLLATISLASILACTAAIRGDQPPSGAGSAWAEIRIVDATTGRGVPSVELETVNGLRFVSDNLGRVAFLEPGLMDREVYFQIRSHGFLLPADGFGFRGRKIVPRAGSTTTIDLPRINLAERVCRLTGEGRLRDSILLGLVPAAAAPLPGGVAGQDSVQATVYRGRIHWFWGDTQRMSYPLGLFRTAGATTPLPTPAAIDPAAGIPYDYFLDPPTAAEPVGFVRAMMPLPERPDGVIWIDGVCTVADGAGADGDQAQRGDNPHRRMVAHYSRRRGLAEQLEQGIAVWDDASATFTVAAQRPLEESWRLPTTHPIDWQSEGRTWLLFGAPTPNVRVPATFAAVCDPICYESFTCADAANPSHPLCDSQGRPQWRWQRDLPPTGSRDEKRWIDAGLLEARWARFCPARAVADQGPDDPDSRRTVPPDALPASPSPMRDGERHSVGPVTLHSGTVRWNAHRQAWILIAGEVGGRSQLGEVWYAESASPTGPFSVAVRIVTHDRQSFYNVCHHPFFDGDGGQTIHFEGTFTREFSGNPQAVPRADYNQVLYRLDLDSAGLLPARRQGG